MCLMDDEKEKSLQEGKTFDMSMLNCEIQAEFFKCGSGFGVKEGQWGDFRMSEQRLQEKLC